VSLPPVATERLLAFHHLTLQQASLSLDVLRELEPAEHRPVNLPDFVLDLSGRDLGVNLGEQLRVHESLLVQRRDVLLFGSNNLVSRDGMLTNEARLWAFNWIEYLNAWFYNNTFPGLRPRVYKHDGAYQLDMSLFNRPPGVLALDEPVFLLTPGEAPIWGRWVATTIPKIMHYHKHGQGRKVLCHVQHPWQLAALLELGIPQDRIIPHDPGATYLCRDVMTVEYGDTDVRLSRGERNAYLELLISKRIPIEAPPKLFVSRLTKAVQSPNTRVLQNEQELARALQGLGFAIIEPEKLTLVLQMALFSRAESVVFLGGSAIYNTAFCRPDAKVVTIESSGTFVNGHAGFFASLGLDYGVIFGQQDLGDPTLTHKRWTLDVEPAVAAIRAYVA